MKTDRFIHPTNGENSNHAIDVNVRVHDKFSVEFKIGYVVDKQSANNEFITNTWIFLPGGMDVTSETYSKKMFYRNMRSYVRLITPIFSLSSVAATDSSLFTMLNTAISEMMANPCLVNEKNAEYQIKMFAACMKSALRESINDILECKIELKQELTSNYINNIKIICERFRNIGKTLLESSNIHNLVIYYTFADEFLSNTIEQYSFYLLRKLKKNDPTTLELIRNEVLELIKEEVNYKDSVGYGVASSKSPDMNRRYVFRKSLLKKYAESQLFLETNRKRDGVIAEQISFSIAAGLSMIFATIISFVFQKKFGNYTTSLFIVLVISYMLKDRIKELVRLLFVHKLAKKYYDHKTHIHIMDEVVGKIREGVDYIKQNNVPKEIMKLRGRTDLLEANNKTTAESIILYRKFVNINGKDLNDNKNFNLTGINDITRFNVSEFIQRMDSSDVPIPILSDAPDGYEIIYGKKTYYINFLMQFVYDGKTSYRRFRLGISRNGIENIERL